MKQSIFLFHILQSIELLLNYLEELRGVSLMGILKKMCLFYLFFVTIFLGDKKFRIKLGVYLRTFIITNKIT